MQALTTDAHRPRRDRRTARALFAQIKDEGYAGGYTGVSDFVRQWCRRAGQTQARQAFVPLRFALGEAFQFDWSEEGLVVGGIYRRLQVAHLKLCASRAFWLVAYPSQGHEMLFDAHTRSFMALGGIAERGIYDNMKTAVDKVKKGKGRVVNARFAVMCAHYLFEPDFCNVASGWEKGIVEKNVQDRRRQIWREVMETRWTDLDALNDWLGQQCRMVWAETKHPEWPELTVAELLQEELPKLMPCPRPFDGYVEHPARVSSTGLIHLERNRYSVPAEQAHRIVSVRVYPASIDIVVDGEKVARHIRSFERDQTIYDWRHYIDLIAQKPGALRNGAPFEAMPEPLRQLQKQLLNRQGGDRVMAQVLAAVPVHGLEAILAATEAALAVGKPSGEHVLYLLAQLKDQAQPKPPMVETALTLTEEPKADVDRYDQLRATPAIQSVLLASPVLASLMMTGGVHVR